MTAPKTKNVSMEMDSTIAKTLTIQMEMLMSLYKSVQKVIRSTVKIWFAMVSLLGRYQIEFQELAFFYFL